MKIHRRLKQMSCFAVILIFIVLLFLATIFLVVKIWQSGGDFVISPSQDIVTTAEYLLMNPLPIREDMYINMNIDYDGLCISDVNLKDAVTDPFWDRWFLNGSRVPYEAYTISYYREDLVTFCIRPSYIKQLKTGLHLVEVEYNASPFWKEFSYQFAIKIEPSPTPSPTLPTP